MKLLRLGEPGKEKPAVIDKDNNYRDLSKIISDYNPDTLNFDLIKKIKNIDILDLPKLDSKLRIGPCVSKPSKFIGIGLNFKDHAEEQNLPIPEEPIIFSKFTSCITGPNDPIIIPKGSEHTDWEVELGLCSYVCTNSMEIAHLASEQLETGSVAVNTGFVAIAEAPFGGIKQSGYGREGGSNAIKDYLNVNIPIWD